MTQIRWNGLRRAFDLWGHPPLVTTTIRRILVVKLCCIGDILFATPLVRALKKNHPQARIDYLVSPWCRDLVAADPRIDTIVEYNPYGAAGRGEKLRRAWRAVRRLRAGRYDVAIVLHRSPLAGLMTALAGIPWRVGFDWQGRGFAYTHRVPYRAEGHEVDRYLACLQPLGDAADGITLEWTPPLAAEQWADQFFRDQRLDRPGGPVIAMFPSGGVNPGTVMTTKRWSPERYGQVGRRLHERYQARLLLVGGQGDAAVGDEVAKGLSPAGITVRAEGRTSLPQLGALLRHCDLFIGGDSGPLYLAEAVGTPTVALFGPTHPSHLGPRGLGHRIVYRPAACSPCHTPEKIQADPVRATTCPEPGQPCMQAITVDDVFGAVVDALRDRGALPE